MNKIGYPRQNAREFESLCQLVRERGVNCILEIGSRDGFSLVRFAEAASHVHFSPMVVSVDMPGGPWGRDGTSESLAAIVANLNARGYDARLFSGDSTSESVIRAVHETISRRCFTFIDGDHRYAGALADFWNYGQLSNIVGFHDIAGIDGQVKSFSGVSCEMGVPRLWREIVEEHAAQPEPARQAIKLTEFIDKDSKYGIGVLEFEAEHGCAEFLSRWAPEIAKIKASAT